MSMSMLNPLNDDKPTTVQVVLIGESNVGKSSLLLQFTQNEFNSDIKRTIGAEFKVETLTVDGQDVKVVFWDIAGGNSFRTMFVRYCRNAHGAVLVYDVTDRKSFIKLKSWLDELEVYSTNKDVVKIIIGNKMDKGKRDVTMKEGAQFARQHDALFMETTAKAKDDVRYAFESSIKKILKTPTFLGTNKSKKLTRALSAENHPVTKIATLNEIEIPTLKIIIMGESGVGKSSLLIRLFDDRFETNMTATVGVDIKFKTLMVDGKAVNVAFWDTAGEEKFRAMPAQHYRNVHGVFFVYDVTDRYSFTKLKFWLDEFCVYSARSEGEVIKIIVGNKIDKKERTITSEEGARFARQFNTLFMETSAKTKDNIQSAFEAVVREIIERPTFWESNAISKQIHKLKEENSSTKNKNSESKFSSCSC